MHRQAGDADDVHPCIGCARRFMVPHRDLQHDVLVEAVQNHCPDVLVVDEIGTRKVSLCTPKILVHFCVTRNKATTLFHPWQFNLVHTPCMPGLLPWDSR